MSNWYNQIVKIEKVEKHPYADNLSIATVMNDYPVIIRTGTFNEGDLASYVSIDSIYPDTDQFYHLCPAKIEKYEENGEVKTKNVGPKYKLGEVPEEKRILKAKKIRNIYSQGLLIDAIPGLKEGDSIVDVLNLKKWEEPEEEENFNKLKTNANAEKSPDGWKIPYYDIEGLRKYISCIGEDEEIVLSEKVHGCFFASSYDGDRLWVKSRNFYKRRDNECMWWNAAIRYDLENKLSKYPMLVFAAELCGQVKKFRYGTEIKDGALQTKLVFFDIYNIKTQRYLDYDDFLSIMKDLDLQTTPLLYRGKWLGKEVMYQYAEDKTKLGETNIREGFVLSTTKERFEPRLNSRMKLKLIGEGYNLQK